MKRMLLWMGLLALVLGAAGLPLAGAASGASSSTQQDAHTHRARLQRRAHAHRARLNAHQHRARLRRRMHEHRVRLQRRRHRQRAGHG